MKVTIENGGTWYLMNKELAQFDPELIVNVLSDVFTMEKGKRGRQPKPKNGEGDEKKI